MLVRMAVSTTLNLAVAAGYLAICRGVRRLEAIR